MGPYGGVLLVIHMRDATLFGYKNHKHGCGRSVIKRTLLEEKFSFPAVSQIYLQGFS